MVSLVWLVCPFRVELTPWSPSSPPVHSPLSQPEEDETIWHVPMQLLLVDKDGKTSVDGTVFLKERDSSFPIAGGGKKGSYKINAGATGVCECLIEFVNEMVQTR